MIQYILRILGFLLFLALGICFTLKAFIFGDIKEAWRELPSDLQEVKEAFFNVLRGEPFL